MSENTNDMQLLLTVVAVKTVEGKITQAEVDAIIKRSQQLCNRMKLELRAARIRLHKGERA